ncbi:hypothetical protein BWI15_35180 [Kribbella sp. ALI-6-A]|uniref:hypothetical protein n=1 Tax=Kribbella sp. ALI-6-A TaxID=1933817 RepID=UPI00097BC7E3|nr:hypothetical protein [Kribbella sp. ALI-6-A]ONI68264.1 hypothetical protein BWI15_35180 [Kribbella sp. ALI-6-A]
MTQPITTATRESSIQAAVEAAKQAVVAGGGTAEELRWKGSKLILPVASVDLDVVLLSPHSHRIKAQLQSLPQAEQAVVATDPYGSHAQGIIARLLRDTPGYERIKNALANEGQLFPGVLTTGGVLVNANTRAVALRELRGQYIKVIVLPADAGPKEITELELRLQMEQDVKQEYTFTSQLLFIEDLINSGNYTTLEIGRALRPALTTSRRDSKAATDLVEGELRLLGLIREVVSASGGAIDFLYFDDQRQALIEIDQDYQRLKSTNPDEAARIRDAQLAGMIAGVDYRRLREIDSTLLDTYVAPALGESTTLSPHLDVLLAHAAVTPPVGAAPAGVSDFFGDDENADGESQTVVNGKPSLSVIYTLLAQTKPEDDVTLPTPEGETVTLPRVVVATELFSGLSTAIENKKRDFRQIDDLTAPMIHLKEAARVLDKAAAAYADVQGRPGFNNSAFRAAVQEYERAAAAFSAAAAPAEDPRV